MSEPRITVIIPTRERCEVLRHALATVVAQDYDGLEILVSDNCSTDGTREAVEAFADPRIRYVATARRVSMSHNWEFALSHVDAGWVTVLGDDDGLLPGALAKVAGLIRNGGVEAIRSRVGGYAWPTIDSPQGTLTVPLTTGIETRRSAHWLAKVLKGAASYPELPMLYNGGFVAHSVIERIRRANGSVYRSSIPDVYAAVAIASVTQTYLFSHEPLAINGASKHSTGTAYFANRIDTQANSADLFHSEDIIPFHADFPLSADGRFPRSLQAMVFESYLQSAKLRPSDAQLPRDRQLEIVLAKNLENDPDVLQWGQHYAQRHGLDFERISRKAAGTRRRLRIAAAPRHFADEVRTFQCTGSAQFPLRDVRDACIATASILAFVNHRRSWLDVLARRVASRLQLRSHPHRAPIL